MLGGNHFLNLTSNIFENNLAKLAGAAIYFNNSILVESPKQNNVFIGNKAALFANDFYTFPVRTIYFDGQEKNLMKYKYLPHFIFLDNFIFAVFLPLRQTIQLSQ